MINLRHILLVEDNLKDVELTLEALKEHNLINRVVHVQDGVEAMDYLKCRHHYKERTPENPSVILLDIKMPKMDGIELLEAIRSDEKLKLIPVVMLTSSREEPDLQKCYKLGVNAYVVKPVNFVAFMDAVKSLGVFWGLINELPFEY
jgi:CheY-like chemotaxis protein